MKTIAVVSAHPGSGQTTIVVNLASGLVRKGGHVLIVDPSNNQKLRRWLGLQPKADQGSASTGAASIGESNIEHSQLGIDLMSFSCNPAGRSENVDNQLALDIGAYEYILLHPSNKGDVDILSRIPAALLVCTDLKHDNELEELKGVELCWQESGGRTDSINLIVPNKINTKEWEHNTEQLFAMADYFGFEKIADPIPHCERVHDLPLDGRTVWDLSQENLREAFLRLVLAVENI
ncbi:MAG: ParA family protein [Syntrophomonadaceae bacterium]